MKLNKMSILVFLLSFHIILNESELINNFDVVTIPYNKKPKEFIYNFSEVTIQEGKDAYFFFEFSYYNGVTFKLINGDKEETTIRVCSTTFCKYKIENLKTQQYIFSITSERKDITMFFIDSSREINITLEDMLNFSFNTESIYNKPPLPLIFTMDPMKQKVFILFGTNQESDIIYDGNSKLEYCDMDEIECNFQSNNGSYIVFEKGKKYKIKYNCNQEGDGSFLFKKYTISSTLLFQEVTFGFTDFSLTSNMKNNYFILDVRNYSTFYIYGKTNKYFKGAFVTEEEKNDFIENKIAFNSFVSDSIRYSSAELMNSEKDYLIISLESSYSNTIEGFFYFFSSYIKIQNDKEFELEQENFALISKERGNSNSDPYLLVSSNKNIGFLNSRLDIESPTNLILLDSDKNYLIYVKSLNEKTSFKYYSFSYFLSKNYEIFETNFTNNNFNKYGDSVFKRTNFKEKDYENNYLYFFGLDEQFYFYNKKYFGNNDFYLYNKELNWSTKFTDIPNFTSSSHLHDNLYDNLVNNKLLIISGYQLFIFFNSYGSLYDLYFQKVNDFEHIQLNSEKYQYNNLVKLLNENKTYYLDFKVDHLIKLGKDFLEAKVTFTDINGNEYILSKDKKVIRDLKGEGIFVKSNKKALLYFYKKMDNITEKGMIEFNRTQIGKNMKFEITPQNDDFLRLFIVEDFGFKGYYPMLSKESSSEVDTFLSDNDNSTIYAANLYDKIEIDEIYEEEGEKYYIYIFDWKKIIEPVIFNNENYILSEPTYIDNLLSLRSKNNGQIIPGNSTGSIILNLREGDIYFQFYKCKNEEIKFIAENSNGNFFFEDSYPFVEIINEDIELDLFSEGLCSFSFESNNEFLFTFNFESEYRDKNKDYSIISVYGISNNLVQIKISPIYNEETQYFLIMSKKDDNNNNETFSDPCYLFKLLDQNLTKSILTKSFYYNQFDLDFFANIVNISQLNASENSELIANIIVLYKGFYDFYKPIEFKLHYKNPYQFQLEDTVKFNPVNNNLFKFEYKQDSELPQYIYFSFDIDNYLYKDIFIVISDNTKTSIYSHSRNKNKIEKIPFNESGTYYIEFYLPNADKNIPDNAFIAFRAEILIDSIDLTEKMYYRTSKVKTNYYVGPDIYKVKNIKKETYVFFSFNIENEDSKQFNNPFQICNTNNDECENNITLYKFVEGNEYNISINFTQKKKSDRNDKYIYFFPSYLFFPISEKIIEEKEEGIYNISEPTLYAVNLENKGTVFLYPESIDHMLISYSKDRNILDNLNDFNWKESSNLESIEKKEGFNYVVILISQNMNNNKGKIIITNQLISNDNQEEIIIPSGKNGIIIFETQNNLDFYNILTMFYSEEKNMILINSDNTTEYSNFIAQNSYPYPIYVDKLGKQIKIKINTFKPKYAYFGVINNNLVDSYISLFSSFSELLQKYNLSQIAPEQLFPLNIRINTDLNRVYDFINFYLYKSEGDINIYIKKYFGETDIYECDADLININNLTILTKPISYCKNKKSILNKIYNFQNNKLITGYLGRNSYLDIYLELCNSKNIRISPIMKNRMNCTSKYLKKDIEYIIDFHVDHLVKLDPEFNAEISIYDDIGNNFIINSENPTAEINGNNFKVKSNSTAMIYFYGKLKNEFKQIQIESNIGRNVDIKIGSLKQYIIDFGFEGYNPMEISNIITSRTFSNENIFIENFYDKLKTKLVKGESLDLWYKNSYNYDAIITYNSKNINNPNNEYTFIVIPKNDENSTLVINNVNMEEIKYHINFCNSPHNLKMFYVSDAESFYERSFEFNSIIKETQQNINKGSYRLRFQSQEDFVFSYSFIDKEDQIFNKTNEWINKRKELTNLTIKEVNKKDNSPNIISIKFYPNYKESSTRYIIVISPKSENYTQENYTNPCFITRLVTEKIEGIQIINIADTGEDDLITIDANISDLFNDENSTLIINIISQELRFEKKLNFYTPYEFSINNDDNGDDNHDDKDDDKKGLSTLHIILISVFGFIFICIILFLVLRYCRKKDKIDFEKQTETIQNEQLMSDI